MTQGALPSPDSEETSAPSHGTDGCPNERAASTHGAQPLPQAAESRDSTEWQGGHIGSGKQLEAVYLQLRRVAQTMIGDERTGVSIQATSLVHEAWMRLHDHDGRWNGERHYFNTAVRAMRRYLIDRARERNALRRGGDRERVAMDDIDWARLDMPVLQELDDEGIEGLDTALADLEQSQPRAAEVVQLRWIAGLTIEQVVEVLGVSADTVKRDWRFGRAWLRAQLGGADTTSRCPDEE